MKRDQEKPSLSSRAQIKRANCVQIQNHHPLAPAWGSPRAGTPWRETACTYWARGSQGEDGMFMDGIPIFHCIIGRFYRNMASVGSLTTPVPRGLMTRHEAV